MPLVSTDRLVSSRRYLMVQQRERRFACWLPEALGPLIRASFVRTLRSRPQRNPVRFTSYAATTRMRRSRSNVLHSAHGSAYAAGQQHSLPPHTRKVAGSKKIFDWNLAADQASILNAFQALDDYLEDMIARRRRTLTDDLISELIRGEDDGEKLDHDELLSLAVALSAPAPTPPVTNGRRRGPSLRLSRPMGAARSARTRSSRGGGSHALPTYRLRPASHRHRIPRAGGGPHPGRNDRVGQHGSRQPRPSSIQRSRPIRYHPRQHGRHAELRQRCALLLGLTPGPARTRPSPDRDGPAHAQPAPYRTSPVVVNDRGHRTHPLCPSNSTPDTEPANQPRAE